MMTPYTVDALTRAFEISKLWAPLYAQAAHNYLAHFEDDPSLCPVSRSCARYGDKERTRMLDLASEVVYRGEDLEDLMILWGRGNFRR